MRGLSLVGTTIMLACAWAACSSTKPCRDGTLFLTVDLGGEASRAHTLRFEVSLDGAPAKSFDLTPAGRPLAQTESFELVLPKTPAHPTVAATVRALSDNGEEVARAVTPQPVAVTGSCLSLSLSVGNPDGGAGGATGGAGAGGSGSSGRGGTGGPGGSAAGSGGAAGGRGGAGGSAGQSGSGGAGSGGTGTSGAGGRGGSGGATIGCQLNATQCASGLIQTCDATGNWPAGVSCGVHRTCTGPVGTAQCTCSTDPTCGTSTVGPACVNDTKLGSCQMDGNGCAYLASSMMCSTGVCRNGGCCTNGCTAPATRCGGGGVQSCLIGADGCTNWVTSACEAPQVCERHMGPACADVAWAEWPMPNGSGGGPIPASYTDNFDGTITDNVTKLMWQQGTSPTTYGRFDDYRGYCAALTLAGYNDWRLPSMIELISIYDFDNGGLDATYFIAPVPSGTSVHYWSSTGYWHLRYDGSANGTGTSTKGPVRCVR